MNKLTKREEKSPDIEIWEQAKREHETAGKILDALKPLSQNERRRILNYMWDRYVTNPEPEKLKRPVG